jgi:hypothetical protein
MTPWPSSYVYTEAKRVKRRLKNEIIDSRYKEFGLPGHDAV